MYTIQRQYPENSEWRTIGDYWDFLTAMYALDNYRNRTSGEYRVITTDPQRPEA